METNTPSATTSKKESRLSKYVSSVANVVHGIPSFFISRVFHLAASVQLDSFLIGFRDKRGGMIADLEEGYGSSSKGEDGQS